MFLSDIDFKLVFAVLAPLVSIVAYIPYLTGMLSGKTRPHVYSWLIWTLTTGTAAAGLWYGGGGWAVVSAVASTLLTFLFFIFSFRYGTKNITTSDTVVLILALLAIIVWWQLDKPLLSIIMVSLIDGFGYIPTYRKSWSEPWSEAVLPWTLWIGYGLCLVLALKSYNPLTLTFVLSTTILANVVLVALILIRRRFVPK